MTKDDSPVPDEFRVNQATLEYLKLRIESEVRDRLLKWIGLPFGGAGLLAVVIGVFWYLPDKMATIIETNPRVEETIRATATNFLQPDNEGGKFIAARLRSHVSNAVSEYLGSDDWRGALNKQIGDQVGKYLGDDQRAQKLIADFFQSEQGKVAITAAVVEKMRSPEVQKLVRDSIDKALAPALEALMHDLRSNADRTIVSAGALAMEQEQFAKEGYAKLEEFVRREHARPASQVRPVIMTLTVAGAVRYNADACAEYSDTLFRALGERFLGTLVTDDQSKFLGLLDPSAFAKSNVQSRELVERINAADVVAIRALLEKVRRGATASVTETTTLARSLRDGLWNRLARPDQPVAVLNDDHQFRGVTTRQRLIGAVGDTGG
jgi:hypothetical protein